MTMFEICENLRNNRNFLAETLSIHILMMVEGKRVKSQYENVILTSQKKKELIDECHRILKEQGQVETYGACGFIEFSNIEHIYCEDVMIDYTIKWSIGRMPSFSLLENDRNLIVKFL